MKLLNLVRLFVFVFVSCAFGEDVVFQPGPEGQDVWLTSYYDYGSNYGVDDNKLQAGGWGDVYEFLIKFDLNTLPPTANRAVLWLKCFDQSDSSTPVGMNLFRVSTSWNEDWSYYSPLGFEFVKALPSPVAGQWYQVDITNLYNSWKSGQYQNEGLLFKPLGTSNNFDRFHSSDSAQVVWRPKLVVSPKEESFKIQFPLAGMSPYTAPVTAVLDHNPQKQVVQAYNGEVGSVSPYYYQHSVVGYKKANGQPFQLPLLNYDDGVGVPGVNEYLFYDNHNGYDYAYSGIEGTPIHAAQSGNMAVATGLLHPSGSLLWRNALVCPMPDNVPLDSWNKYHACFIIHEAGYSTWYLHDSDLEPSVKAQILFQGYATVEKGDVIGYVGNFGPDGTPNHLHFGMRKNSQLIDPYGNGSPDSILWNVLP